MTAIAVFCGSKPGNNALYETDAWQLGQLLAKANLTLVYGAGNKGLMGAVANGTLEGGGQVIGIIPEHLLAWEQDHKGLTEIIVVPDMHTRKRLMYERCDGAIILPGGFGTMDELFELLTWNQLTLHDKPVFILNTAGFYTHMLQQMHTMHSSGFLYDNIDDMVKIADTPQAIIDLLLV